MMNVSSSTTRPLELPQMVGRNRSRLSYTILAVAPLIAAVGLWVGTPLLVTLSFAALWAMFAIGFDIFSGYTDRINMGYAMFPGIAGYTSAILSVKFGIAPWLSAPAGVLMAVFLAALLGAMTLRIQGTYFALATAIVPMAFYQLVHIFDRFFGGEEGIYGVPAFFEDQTRDFMLICSFLFVVGGGALWYVNSKAGIALRAIKGGELTAKALGVDTFRHLMVAFLISALIGGVAGACFAHFQMFIGPEIFFIVATLQIVTFAQVGGPGTIVGPMIGAILLTLVNENLREIAEIRLLAYFVGLVFLLRFFPDGLIVPLLKQIGQTFRRSKEKK
jgi:branched-chain amino acid transport system permease protein